jgi:hypothetical protein|tara:strand:+ start:2327 stop:2725 length:399 start_codon:yes stop_codon:yes gene_type:complete
MTPIKKGEKKNVKKEAFLMAFESSACNVSISCKKVGISRNTFYEWKKKDLVFAEAVHDQNEGLLDFAETMLYKAIKEGKTPELIFFLKTKGQSRGYIEKQRIETSQSKPDLTGMSITELRDLAYGSDPITSN